MKKIMTVGALMLVLVTGCALPPVKNTVYKEVEKKRWEPGQGPLVNEVVHLSQKNIVEIAKDRSRLFLEKGKFETDLEYEQRRTTILAPVFVVAPISTSRDASCESLFSHEQNRYKIKNCLPFLESRPIFSESNFGEKFNLANAYDSRAINRNMLNKYFLVASVSWADEFSISKETAKELDSELMVGIIIKNPTTTSYCSLCNSRNLEDSIDSLAKALGSRKNNNGWRDRAFREGEIIEDWNYTVASGGISEMVIFKKSDQRILYHVQYVLEDQANIVDKSKAVEIVDKSKAFE